MFQVKKSAALTVLVFSVVMQSNAANAATSGSNAIDIRGYVPTVCTLQFAPVVIQRRDGEVDLGTMHEFCNSPAGYVVRLNYRPGSLVGARFTTGGSAVTLDGSGSAVLVDAEAAGMAARRLRFDGNGGQGESIHLLIEAKA